MKRVDVIVIGAGPAGLSAAIQGAKSGMVVKVFDENAKPGGQLFKQIHKFFGSKEHQAKIRGFRIGEKLLAEAAELGVEVILNASVIGLYQDKEITVRIENSIYHYKADSIIVATGATENVVTFDGWTLPGVMGAGAAQTMMNLHQVQPGKRVLMLGSGNVGLVVGYQLLQAGCELVAVIDAAPKIGGYGVHAAKIARAGVPFYLSHTIQKASGTDKVTGVTIAEVDHTWKTIPNTEQFFEVDTICLAVGLSPMSQLLGMAGCQMQETPGGYVPICKENGETSIPGIFAAGDVSGIEEASSAMIEGKIAGLSAAEYLGFLDSNNYHEKIQELEMDLSSLRQGMFAPKNRGVTLEKTDEGFPLSKSLLKHGYLSMEDITVFPGMKKGRGVHPVMECTQNIPCNPCQDSCHKSCIRIGSNITALPEINENASCVGCGMCVASCSGQAIFLVDEDYTEGFASITIPYEFLPSPVIGEIGNARDRSGKELCKAEIISFKQQPAFDKTALLTMKVPKEFAMEARFFQRIDA